MVAAVANLLDVKIPSSYEVSGGPDWGPLALLGGLRVPHQGFAARVPSLLQGTGTARLTRPTGALGPTQPQLSFTPIGTGEDPHPTPSNQVPFLELLVRIPFTPQYWLYLGRKIIFLCLP